MNVTSYGLNKNLDDEIKKNSGTSSDVLFKEFSLTTQTTRPRTDYEWIEKPISKKSDKKPKKNQCQNAARENKKQLARNVNLIQTKKAWNELWIDWENRLEIQSQKLKNE